MSSHRKRCLSVLMRDCTQLDLGSMRTRVGTGNEAVGSRWTLWLAISATWLTAFQTNRCLQEESFATIKTESRAAILFFLLAGIFHWSFAVALIWKSGVWLHKCNYFVFLITILYVVSTRTLGITVWEVWELKQVLVANFVCFVFMVLNTLDTQS